MPYETHPSWETPPDDTLIWRYMDYTKFALLLQRKELFFSSTGKFSDRYEGYIPPTSISEIEKASGGKLPDAVRDGIEAANKSRGIRDYVLANCWQQSEHESVAMWGQYLRGAEGVAVRSNIGGLKKSLARTDSAVWIGAVEYLPNDKFHATPHNALLAFLRKRRGYNYESEVRAMCFSPQLRKLTGPLGSIDPWPGYGMPVDIQELIKDVVVAPQSQDWFIGLVDAALANAGLTLKSLRSDLDAEL